MSSVVYQVEIEDDEGNRSVVPVSRPEISIGRQDGNVIRLTDRNVSRQHAILFSNSGRLSLEDLESYTGTQINGVQVEGNKPLKLGDVISIGEYELRILAEGDHSAGPDDSQVTLIDNNAPGSMAARAPSPLIIEDEDEDADPTAVINLRAGLGATVKSSYEGLLDGPPARLVVVSRALAGTEYTIDRSPARIGRGNECEVRVDHPSISRHHATIEMVDGRFVVKDVGSANGIQVNGETYAVIRLQPGDRIDMGHIQLRFFPPGQIPEFADMLSMRARPAGSNALVTAMLVVLLAAVAGGAWWFLRGQEADNQTAANNQAVAMEDWSTKLQELRDTRQWRKALDLLESAPADVPTKELTRWRAELSDERKYKEALDNALRQKATMNYAKALEYLQSIPKNSVYFDDAERHRPEVREAFVRLELDLAKTKVQNGKLDEAKRHMESAELYDADEGRITALRAMIAERTAAAKPARPAQRPAGPTAKVLLEQANRKLVARDAAGALPLLQKAVRKAPNHPQIHRGLGIAYATTGNDKMARKHYRRYLELAPNSPEAPQVRKMLGQ